MNNTLIKEGAKTSRQIRNTLFAFLHIVSKCIKVHALISHAHVTHVADVRFCESLGNTAYSSAVKVILCNSFSFPMYVSMEHLTSSVHRCSCLPNASQAE